MIGIGLLVAAATAASGSSSFWTPVGPFGGPMFRVAVDPTNPAVLYTASVYGSGIFISSDGGASWRRAAASLRDVDFYELEVDREGTVWARVNAPEGAGRLLRVPGGGSIWEYVPIVGEAIAEGLALDPGNAATLYVTGNGATQTEQGLFRSTDHGSTWRSILRNCASAGDVSNLPQVVAIDPTDSPVLYASSSKGLCKTTDAGGSWAFTDMGIPAGRGNGGGHWAIDPHDPRIVYAAITDWGFARSTDAGTTWVHQSPLTPGNGYSASYLQQIVLDSASPSTLYATGEWAGYRSEDGGDTWTQLDQLPCSAPSWLVALPGMAGGLAGAGSGGLCRSFDGGATWSEVEAGLRTVGVTHLAVDPVDPFIVYAGSYGRSSLQRTTDGGTTWSAFGASASGEAAVAVVDPSQPGTAYSWSSVMGSGLFRSGDYGMTWTRVLTNGCLTDDSTPGALAVHPTNPAVLIAGGTGEELCRSTDGGASWTRSSIALSHEIYYRTIVFDASQPQDVYAGGLYAQEDSVFKSTDGGSTWFGLAVNSSVWAVDAIATDPFTPGVVLLSGYIPVVPTYINSLLRSTDAGATWVDASAGLPVLFGELSQPRAIAADPNEPGTYYALVPTALDQAGVYRSTDGGLSWELLNRDGLHHTWVLELAISPADPRRLYVSADGFLPSGGGGGIFSIDLPVTEPVPAFGPGAAVAALLLVASRLAGARQQRERWACGGAGGRPGDGRLAGSPGGCRGREPRPRSWR